MTPSPEVHAEVPRSRLERARAPGHQRRARAADQHRPHPGHQHGRGRARLRLPELRAAHHADHGQRARGQRRVGAVAAPVRGQRHQAGLYKKAGEFPAPLEHDFAISADASRYYASGRGFFYRTFPFWIASLIERILAIVVPMTIILVPGIKIAPAVFRWRTESRIYRWYAVLQHIDRTSHEEPQNQAGFDALLHRLAHMESAVMKLAVPPAYGDVLYDLRGDIAVVRKSLLARRPAD